MADQTPNRGYELPDAGTTDWHVPLNDNLLAIDEDVQQALQSGGGDSNGSKSAKDRARDGFVTFQVPGGGPVHEHDPAGGLWQAVQDAVDSAENISGLSTPIYIPHWGPGGEELDMTDTAVFGRNGNAYPQFVGADGRDGYYIRSEIDNGSPCFLVEGARLNGVVLQGAQATGQFFDSEFIRFVDCNAFNYVGGDHRAFCGPAGASAAGAIVFDSECFNGSVIGSKFNGIDAYRFQDPIGGMNGIAFVNDSNVRNGRPPGEWGIHFISSYADPDLPMANIVHSPANTSGLRVTGSRLEGAGDEGLVYTEAGSCLIACNELGRSETNKLRIDSFTGYIGLNQWGGSCDGHGITETMARGQILSAGNYNKINGGHVIDASPNAPGQVKYLPDPAPLQSRGYTVSYPSGTSGTFIRKAEAL